MFRLNRNKQKTNQNSLKESIFWYFSENLGLFWFVTKQFCMFRLFRYRFKTPKQTQTNRNKPVFLVSRNKPKHKRNRSCFSSNRIFFCLFRGHHSWDPPTPPLPPHFGSSYTRALLVSQDRRHLFVTPCSRGFHYWTKNGVFCSDLYFLEGQEGLPEEDALAHHAAVLHCRKIKIDHLSQPFKRFLLKFRNSSRALEIWAISKRIKVIVIIFWVLYFTKSLFLAESVPKLRTLLSLL